MVARDAVFKILPGQNILSGMSTAGNIFDYFIMAGCAGVGLKEFRRAAIDIDRVRVSFFIRDLAMAVLTG